MLGDRDLGPLPRPRLQLPLRQRLLEFLRRFDKLLSNLHPVFFQGDCVLSFVQLSLARVQTAGPGLELLFGRRFAGSECDGGVVDRAWFEIVKAGVVGACVAEEG